MIKQCSPEIVHTTIHTVQQQPQYNAQSTQPSSDVRISTLRLAVRLRVTPP
jgi:hypothetical protein